jgi:hypothetical protein
MRALVFESDFPNDRGGRPAKADEPSTPVNTFDGLKTARWGLGLGRDGSGERGLKGCSPLGAVRVRENQFPGVLISENRSHHSTVYPQGGAVGGRRELAGQVGHHRRNFIHGGKALQ